MIWLRLKGLLALSRNDARALQEWSRCLLEQLHFLRQVGSMDMDPWRGSDAVLELLFELSWSRRTGRRLERMATLALGRR